MRHFLLVVGWSGIVAALPAQVAPAAPAPPPALTATTADADELAAAIRSPSAWSEREVGDGVWLRHRRFARLFDAPQSVTVLEVRPGPDVRFDLGVPAERATTSAIGAGAGALAAINGGYFDIQKTGKSIGLLRLDGALVVPADAGQASLGLDAAGALRLALRPAGDWPEVVDALGAGPMLLTGGVVREFGERQRRVRHPRSAVGVTADGRVVWLAVDGRTEPAAGMTFAETATVLAALGCRDALNLDGGGSTTLWVAGLGVCNHPCDNKRYDHAGERRVANALLLHAPAVCVVDDDDAVLAGGGWRQRDDGEGVHGPDFAASDDPAATATFAVALPAAGRWRVAARVPRADGAVAAWRMQSNGAAAGADVPPGPGITGELAQWVALGEVDAGVDRRTTIVLRAARAVLTVDAVRFVQLRPAGR